MKYIIRSLWFYRKQHLAVFAGVVISTAVLTGALIVGDSVKYSLKGLVDTRLGGISYAMQTGDRYVESRLADDMEEMLGLQVEPALMLQGFGVNPDLEKRVNSIQVLGIDTDFKNLFNARINDLEKGEAYISASLADQLEIEAGSEFLLRVEDASVIPLNAPFAQEALPSVGIRLEVVKVLNNDKMGRFNLKSNQAAPLNVYLNREFLAETMGLNKLVNTILVADNSRQSLQLKDLEIALKKCWQPEDLGIHIKDLPGAGKMEIQSNRIFIDDPITRVIMDPDLNAEPLLTYLVNSIHSDDGNTPYSFVTAASSPYLPDNVQDNEIVINQWLAEDLNATIGDTITLDYFVVGPLRKLEEKNGTFRISDVIPTATYPIDSTLMPEYPGLSEANNCRDWETGIPIDLKLIRDKDEFYWDDYQGTPKGLISYNTGKKLWANDFGTVTALRIDKSRITIDQLKEMIISGIDPGELNLFFQPVYQQGVLAADNSVDFGELFLSLSFFVIAAGILLIILLFSLQTESRMMEAGILSALGYNRRAIIVIRFLESFLIALLGGIVGAAGGMIYNYVLILGLNTVWTDAVHTNVLQVYVLPETLLTGALTGVILALLSIYVVSLRKLKRPVTILLKKLDMGSGKKKKRRININLIVAVLALGTSLVMVVLSIVSGMQYNSGMLLAAGGLIIPGCVALISLYLTRRGDKSGVISGSFADLALVNAGRNRFRSLMTILLFALGTFTIIITGANRKSFYGSENDRSSGTGGFLFWTETAVPLPIDLQTKDGREKLGIVDTNYWHNNSVVQLLALDGDDASCLNLNQVQQPRILGVDPVEFDGRGAFSFAKLIKGVDESKPWLELKKQYAPDVLPAFADQTVIIWGLKMKVGDTLHYVNEAGNPMKLVLAGGFKNSIFQGNLLIDEARFRENFPSVSGSTVMLVEGTSNDQVILENQLSGQLADYGVDISATRERMALFNSVENTYLTVFMMLGGLGVLIGTIGLAVVLIRNMMERKKELALMSALGFQQKELVKITFLENLMLLSSGMLIGLIGAFVGILPSLLLPEFVISGNFIFLLVAIIFITGLVWIWIPSRKIVKLPLVPSLRDE